MSQTIAFIPTRIGSQSIPKKNIKSFLGKPLVYWVIDAAQQCGRVDRIVLSIDSKEIEDAISEYDFSKLELYYRAAHTATHEASTESAMLDYLGQSDLKADDLMVLLQATSPYTTSEDISTAISLADKPEYDSILSCVRAKHFLWTDEGKALNYNPYERPRRQDFNGHLQENGAIYISQVSSIKQEKNRLSGRIGIYEMADYTAFEIDEPEDWIIAEALMKHQKFK